MNENEHAHTHITHYNKATLVQPKQNEKKKLCSVLTIFILVTGHDNIYDTLYSTMVFYGMAIITA